MKAYRYLAVGNSLTLHGVCDYWWNEVGMAASCAETDYVHLVTAALGTRHGAVATKVFNFAQWETAREDRDAALPALRPYFDWQPDLITIQLGENVGSELGNFLAEFERLLMLAQTAVPQAKLLVIGDFWVNDARDRAKERAAKHCGVPYVSLRAADGEAKYRCGIGTTVYDAQGQPHTVEHEGVAAHPGDAGMQWIASQMLAAL